MIFFRNIKRSKSIAAALLAAMLLAGCEPSQQSYNSGYSSDTHLPNSDNGESSDLGGSSESVSGGGHSNSSDNSQNNPQSGSSTSDNAGESSSGDSSGESVSGSSGGMTSPASSEPGGERPGVSDSNSTGSASSSSSSDSSTVKPPDPPVQVVIPDFEVPASPGVNVFSAANGWVDYTNASKGYISAKYTGDKARSKLRIAANGETYTYDLSVGGVIEYFPLSIGNGTYTVILFELIEGSSYSIVLQEQFEVSITDPRSPFTYSNRYVDYNESSQCVYKAAELCTGKTDNISKIAAIFKWVTDNISYDNQLATNAPKTYYPDPDKTMQKRTGICYDYASLMAAMLRSQGIPTRLVIGYAGSTKHAWNEIYTEQTGWITPELFLANNGYNTADATFYSGAADKKQIADYISNPANYSSLYYY